MRLERILARRFLYQDLEDGDKKRGLRPAVRLTTAGIALGVTVVLLSFFVVAGFKKEIRSKVNGLVGSIVISNPHNVYGSYSVPLSLSSDARDAIRRTILNHDPEAKVFSFCDVMTLLKSDSAFSGVLLRGVGPDYNADFLQSYITEGVLPDFGGEGSQSEIVISSLLSKKLDLQTGDEIMAYFTTGASDGADESAKGVKIRKLRITGIFSTGLEDFDQKVIIGNAGLVQNLLLWSDGPSSSTQDISGLMVQINKGEETTAKIYDDLYSLLADRYTNAGEEYAMNTAYELSNGLLDWIRLLDANVYLILTLLTAVAGMTMITSIIVLVLEKVRAIATLKALGESDRSLRKIFRLMALSILLRGLLWGNISAILIALVQKKWHLISLDASQYYMNYVPILMDPMTLLCVNIVVFLVVYLLVLIPVILIGKVSPGESLRFE